MAKETAPAGDLGRRLMLRREELGLTREEVADRAGTAPGYLQYVEDQPTSLPGPTFMLRVADALETTVTQLRGGTTERPPMGEAAARPAFTELDLHECIALLSDHGIGRIAVTTDAGPAILPVNYDMVDQAVVFRTERASTLNLATDREVAFEVDRIDEALSEGWSVLMIGLAAEITSVDEIRSLRDRTLSSPWVGGDRPVWMRIHPARVTGRRITAG